MLETKKLVALFPGILAVLMTVTGCTSYESSSAQSHETPEAAYEAYLALIRQDTSLVELASHWDSQAREMFMKTSDSSGRYIPIEAFETSLRYPELFAEAPTSPQSIKVTPEAGCLLLIGPAADGGVLALSILMKKHEATWQHSELFARYIEPQTLHPIIRPATLLNHFKTASYLS